MLRHEYMYDLFHSLLSDENGISEESFNLMYDYVDMTCNEFHNEESKKIKSMLGQVDAQDSRFYLPEGWAPGEMLVNKEAELHIQVCNSRERRYTIILSNQIWKDVSYSLRMNTVKETLVSLPEDAFGNPTVFPAAITFKDRKTGRKENYVLVSSYDEEGSDKRVSEYTNSIFAKQKRVIRIYLGKH